MPTDRDEPAADAERVDPGTESSPHVRRRSRWRATFLVLAMAAFAIWWSVLRPPAWWRVAGDTSPEAVARGVGLENAMVTEVTRVRDGDDPWGFVVADEDLNAWLATRFDPWLASRGADDMLAVIGDPRVRLVADGIEIGVAGPLGGVAIGRFGISIDGDSIVLRPLGGSVGLVPIGGDSMRSGLAALADAIGGGTAGIDATAEDGVRLPREISLSDGRRVVLDDLEIVPGELAVRWRTLGP